MSKYDWQLSPGSPLCVYSEPLYRTGRAIIQNLTDETPEMVVAALEALAQYHAELASKLKRHPMHYGALVGSHRCLESVYQEAVALLRGLSATFAHPPAPPARTQPPRSPDAVVNDIGSLADEVKRPGDTYLGEERGDNTASGESR
jgi:hypothetical protein